MKLKIIVLSFVTFLITSCSSKFDAVNNSVLILQERLKSPSSFKLISSEVYWEGITKDGNSAYIVKLDYDSQNSFGAILRACNLVAFWRNSKESKVYWDNLRSVDDCNITQYMKKEDVVKMFSKYIFGLEQIK